MPAGGEPRPGFRGRKSDDLTRVVQDMARRLSSRGVRGLDADFLASDWVEKPFLGRKGHSRPTDTSPTFRDMTGAASHFHLAETRLGERQAVAASRPRSSEDPAAAVVSRESLAVLEGVLDRVGSALAPEDLRALARSSAGTPLDELAEDGRSRATLGRRIAEAREDPALRSLFASAMRGWSGDSAGG